MGTITSTFMRKIPTPALLALLTAIVATALLCSAEALSSNPTGSTSAIRVTDIPPLVDVPVWSMATLNDDGDNGDAPSTNLNLLTYASPVAIRPHRLYALGLFRKTLSRDNFLREKTCVLQLLSSAAEDRHIGCVRLLGGISGKDVAKEAELASTHGIELKELEHDDDDGTVLPRVLPGCVRYLQLSMVGDVVPDGDGGEESCHDVVICKVDRMWTSSDDSSSDDGHLSTGKLRELGLITEQGRIAPLPDDE